jgi:hypothetical protein
MYIMKDLTTEEMSSLRGGDFNIANVATAFNEATAVPVAVSLGSGNAAGFAIGGANIHQHASANAGNVRISQENE